MQDIRVPATKKKSAVTKVTALFLFPSHSNPNSHFITSTFLLCECEVPKYQDKCESEGSFSLRSSLLFLAKRPITSIRNEMQDIRVSATKKKSAITKVIALFLFPLTLTLTLILTLVFALFFRASVKWESGENIELV
jgi:hypothetical protein